MNRKEFLAKVKEILQYEGIQDLNYETNLLDLEEWDSISIISMVAFLDSNFDKKVKISDLQNIDTVEDLAKLAGL